MRLLLAGFASLCWAGSASAASYEEARRAYASGEFIVAAAIGEGAGDPASLTLAAQSLIAECIVRPEASRAGLEIDRAIDNAEAALAAEPNSVSARLNLALALGMKGRRVSKVEAWRAGYAQRGRKLIEEALALEPGNARAHALMGAWHLEVLRRGGSAGSALMGASFKKGAAAFDRARALAPRDTTVAMQYALALLSLDAKKHQEQAADLLAVAGAGEAHDQMDMHLREEARRLGAVLASKGALAARQAAEDAFL